MRKVNTNFYILFVFALFAGAILFMLPNKASALLFASRLSCMGTRVASAPLASLIFLTAGAIAGIGLLSLLIQIIKTRIFVGKLVKKRTPASLSLTKILNNLNLQNKVILVKNRNLFSFCAGYICPFIVVSTALAKFLTKKELEAVLLHEQSHLSSRDPLKALVGKTFSSMFFFLPVFGELHKNAESSAEFLADAWTISRQKRSNFLKKALKKILTAPASNLNLVSNASGPDSFEIRIQRLINPQTKYKFRFSPVNLATAFLFILAGLLILSTPPGALHMANKDLKDCHFSPKEESRYIPAHMLAPEKRCD